MSGITAWVGVAVIVLLWAVLTKVMKRKGRLGQSVQGLKQLVERQNGGQSGPEDLSSWETFLDQLQKYPSEYNELNHEIRFIESFAHFLEQYYPSDARLPVYQAAAASRKDTIWGFKINHRNQEH